MNSYTIVVAVANPNTVDRLMHTACLIATQFAGRIMVTTVVSPTQPVSPSGDAPANRISQADQLLQQALDYAKMQEVACESTISLARQIHEGIVEVASAQQAHLVVVGFSQHDQLTWQPDNFDRIIDAIAAHSPCHLLVANFRNGEKFERVLVPIASQFNLDLTKDIVIALHYQGSATVDFVHFAASEEQVEHITEELAQWLDTAGVADCGTVRVQVNPKPAQAIVQASQDYDAVIVGTPPLHTLRRRLFGSIAEQVANDAACTTYLVRRGNAL